MRAFIRVVFALFLAVPATAFAGTITGIVSANGSGDFNGTPFTNQDIVLTFTGHTEDVVNIFPVAIYVDGTSAFVTVGAVKYTITDPMRLFILPFETDGTTTGLASIGDLANGETTIPFYDSAFQTYDLLSSFGPITGNYFENVVGTIGVAGGTLTVDASTFSNRSFEVTVTPEPSSFALLGTGALGLVGVVRRKFSRG